MMTMANMLETVFTLGGIAILLYGLWMARKLRHTLGTGELKDAWDVLYALIGVFVAGYAVFLANITVYSIPLDSEIITAAVFLLGSMFVAITAYYNYRVFADV